MNYSKPGPSFLNPAHKRKQPSQSPGLKPEPGVKTEWGQEVKRVRPILSASHGGFKDVRTAAAAMVGHLKVVGTMGWQDAWFHAETQHPEHDVGQVLNILKKLEKIDFNEINNVFSYIPDLTLKNQVEIRNHIRTQSSTTKGLLVKDFKEALPQNGIIMLEDMEKKGEILIMKALTGSFKDIPLPPLGLPNVHGFKINDQGVTGAQRFRMVFWDDMHERGRTGKRVDQEFISAWDKVDIPETADVTQLLEQANIGASSVAPPPPKILASGGPVAKKKKKRTALKITNTHMKSLGIDFSKDYDG